MRNSAINAYIYSGIFVVTYVFVYNYKPISEKCVNLEKFSEIRLHYMLLANEGFTTVS